MFQSPIKILKIIFGFPLVFLPVSYRNSATPGILFFNNVLIFAKHLMVKVQRVLQRCIFVKIAASRYYPSAFCGPKPTGSIQDV